MAQIKFYSDRLKDVIKENPNFLGAPIGGLSMVSPTTLTNAIKPLQGVVPDIQKHAEDAMTFSKNSAQPGGVARDGVAAVHLLTQAWPRPEDSFFNIINSRLRDTNRNSLKPFFPILKNLLTTLSPWPTTDKTTWRGVDKDLSGQFRVGQTVLWWGFGTGTTNRSDLDSPPIFGNYQDRTIFKLETVKAHEVGGCTERRDPNEVLLAPGLFFEVTEIIDGGDMATWTVVMKDTMPMMKAMDFPI